MRYNVRFEDYEVVYGKAADLPSKGPCHAICYRFKLQKIFLASIEFQK